MHKSSIIEPGLKAGRLIVIEVVGPSRDGTLWRCKCLCGNERIISVSRLNQIIKGALRNKKPHGGCVECCRERRLSMVGPWRQVPWNRLSLSDRKLAKEIGLVVPKGRL